MSCKTQRKMTARHDATSAPLCLRASAPMKHVDGAGVRLAPAAARGVQTRRSVRPAAGSTRASEAALFDYCYKRPQLTGLASSGKMVRLSFSAGICRAAVVTAMTTEQIQMSVRQTSLR